MEVRREDFGTVVRTRDLLTYRERELKYWNNMCCRMCGTKGKDVLLPDKEKNLGNMQSSAVLYINNSNPECVVKYKPNFYILYM